MDRTCSQKGWGPSAKEVEEREGNWRWMKNCCYFNNFNKKINYAKKKFAYLFSFNVTISDPFAQSGSPIFQHVSFCKFLSFAITKSTLGFCGRDHVNSMQIYFQPFLRLCGDFMFRTPCATVTFLSYSAQKNNRINIIMGILVIWIISDEQY